VFEAAEILRVSSKTISRMVNDGKLPRIQGMRQIRIPVDGLEQWVTDNTV
jgi:excisionase family DNA binding protein